MTATAQAPSSLPPPMPDLGPPSEDDTSRMSFGDHLEELRRCVIRGLLGFALAAVVMLIVGDRVLMLILRPLFAVQEANGLQAKIQALGPTDMFSAYLRISFLAGLIVAMPWLLHQGWSFVSSGLYAQERRFAKRLTFGSTILFTVGVLFLYYLVLPVVLQFFISFNRAFFFTGTGSSFATLLTSEASTGTISKNGVVAPLDAASSEAPPLHFPLRSADPPEPQEGDAWINTSTRRLVARWDNRLWSTALQPGALAPAVESEFAVPAYISFVLMLALAFGIAFETPIVVIFLSWSNLVRAETMAHARRYVIMGIVVVAAIITPPDVISLTLLALPMYGLFELGLLLARSVESRRATAS